MSRVFWDTNVFIYFFEDFGPWGQRVQGIYERMRERSDTLVTGALTVGEILVKPIRAKQTETIEKLTRFFSSPAVTVVPFDGRVARRYAQIRADKSIHPADAIQLSCAASIGCDLFITNDRQLIRTDIAGITFIASLDTAPL